MILRIKSPLLGKPEHMSEFCPPALSPVPDGGTVPLCACALGGQLIKFGAAVKNGKHPVWFPPAPDNPAFKGLRANNSLTGRLEPFAPASGNRVLWYTCGPTVYDSCHMGHARAYLTMDILRRIMEDYFG